MSNSEIVGARADRIMNLNNVIAATDGDAVIVVEYEKLSVFIRVSVNTGAVTVTIETSPDGTNWYELDQKVWTASTGKDVYSYVDVFRFMRITTTTQSNSTVEATIIGRR